VPLSVPFGTPVTIPTASLPETTAGVPYSNANYAQYYKFAVNKRKDHLYGLTLDTPITDSLTWSPPAYYEDKSGYGVSPEAYATSLTSYNAERLIVAGLTAPQGHSIRPLGRGRHAQGRDRQVGLAHGVQQDRGRPLARERRLSPHPGALQRRER
jgi:hypothetical protein